MIYAYGICEPLIAAAAARRRGLGGATLRVLERSGLAAVYSRHRTLRPRPNPELVVAHERVVEAIMARGTVLPLRFGTELGDEDQLAAIIDTRHDELLRSLERLRGKAEVGIRLIPAASTVRGRTDERTGRGYLLARARAQRRFDQAVHDLHAALAALSVASCVRQLPRPPAIFAASYLVDLERVAEFRRQAAQLGRRQSQMRLIVTGPWPPYNFATEEHR